MFVWIIREHGQMKTIWMAGNLFPSLMNSFMNVTAVFVMSYYIKKIHINSGNLKILLSPTCY